MSTEEQRNIIFFGGREGFPLSTEELNLWWMIPFNDRRTEEHNFCERTILFYRGFRKWMILFLSTEENISTTSETHIFKILIVLLSFCSFVLLSKI